MFMSHSIPGTLVSVMNHRYLVRPGRSCAPNTDFKKNTPLISLLWIKAQLSASRENNYHEKTSESTCNVRRKKMSSNVGIIVPSYHSHRIRTTTKLIASAWHDQILWRRYHACDVICSQPHCDPTDVFPKNNSIYVTSWTNYTYSFLSSEDFVLQLIEASELDGINR